MAHLLGVYLPPKAGLEQALTRVYGLGRRRSQALILALGFPSGFRVRDLTKRQRSRLVQLLKGNLFLGSDLRKAKSDSIQRLVEIGSYKGIRHRWGLPLRGQRTSTNGRSQRALAAHHRRGG